MTGAEEITEKNVRKGKKTKAGLDYLSPLWGMRVTMEVGHSFCPWLSLGRRENRVRNPMLLNMATECSGLLREDWVPLV